MKSNYVVVYRLMANPPSNFKTVWDEIVSRKDIASFPNNTLVDQFNTKSDALKYCDKIAPVCLMCGQYKLQNIIAE